MTLEANHGPAGAFRPQHAMAPKPSPAGPLKRLQALVGAPLGRALLRVGCAALVLLVAGLLVKRARAHAYRMEAYRIGPDTITFVDLPQGLEAPFQRALHHPRWLDISTSVFDAEAEPRIRGVVARHPLVGHVRQVRVIYPNRAEVSVAIRAPAARFEVRRRDGSRVTPLVSADARILPDSPYADYLAGMRIPLPLVTGVRTAPPRVYGQAWVDRDEQVAEALAAAHVAARLYRDFYGRIHVVRIDVSAFPARPEQRRDGEVRLYLHDGTCVEWGRTERALDGVASEDTYDRKRWRLETRLTEAGRVAGRKIDVRFPLRGESRGLPGES